MRARDRGRGDQPSPHAPPADAPCRSSHRREASEPMRPALAALAVAARFAPGATDGIDCAPAESCAAAMPNRCLEMTEGRGTRRPTLAETWASRCSPPIGRRAVLARLGAAAALALWPFHRPCAPLRGTRSISGSGTSTSPRAAFPRLPWTRPAIRRAASSGSTRTMRAMQSTACSRLRPSSNCRNHSSALLRFGFPATRVITAILSGFRCLRQNTPFNSCTNSGAYR